MWITRFLIILGCISTTKAMSCENVHNYCQNKISWIRCYDDNIRTCTQGRKPIPDFIKAIVNSTEEVAMNASSTHKVHIPSSALRKSVGSEFETKVQVLATVVSSSYFKLSPPPEPIKQRIITRVDGIVMGGLVLVVKAGNRTVENLEEPIQLTFKRDKQVKEGTCVFWQESYPVDGTGLWSRHGCSTSDNGAAFICSCNHLSFFAVLVNPDISVDEANDKNLSYITYVGSALSVVFTVISLIIYICVQRRRPEKAIGVHMHLTLALLSLHLSFLLCSFWVWKLKEDEEGLVCQVLGLVLHWTLLATFCWTALEGFHLYLLLVRVFNIYVSKYLLKLCLVGWGLPTLIVVICGISGVYGKYNLELINDKNQNLTASICWMSSQFPQRRVVSYITTLAFPCLVIIYNSCMLGLVVFKLWGMRGGDNSWKRTNKQKGSRLWKDCVTVLGLSCVLGLPWGLTSTTYLSLTGIYVFTILNSLQGVCMFLWSLALTCKSRAENSSSVRSCQKMMTTSFNS